MEKEALIQDRYRLSAPIGTGGMAEVWVATDERLNRSVAVKFLSSRLAEEPEFLVRFFAEAQAVAGISHPNVVQVLDFGEHAGVPYLVMEYVVGGTLTDLIGDPVTAERATELIAGAARGAGAAHAVGVVHRDIKPANILMDETGEPKLADFGIAANDGSERLTATGAAIGSPHYISPEQASSGSASPASDVYSLGIVLYELLTGVRPFDGDNVTAIAIAHVDKEPDRPSRHVPDLDPVVDALVLRCLAKDPAERFEDGNALAAALEGRAGGAVVGAVAEPIAEAARWTSRRIAVATVLALVLLGALALGAVRWGDTPATAEDDPVERLDDVGGLRLPKDSPTPDEDEDVAVAPTPSPSDDKKEGKKEGKKKDKEDEGDDETTGGGGGTTADDDSEPSPSPTADEPSPEPTSDGTASPSDSR